MKRLGGTHIWDKTVPEYKKFIKSLEIGKPIDRLWTGAKPDEKSIDTHPNAKGHVRTICPRCLSNLASLKRFCCPGEGRQGLRGPPCQLRRDRKADSVVTGSAIASFTVSAFGVEGLLNITKAEIEERIKHIKMEIKD